MKEKRRDEWWRVTKDRVIYGEGVNEAFTASGVPPRK